MDKGAFQLITDELQRYFPRDTFTSKQNVYAYSIYNSLDWGSFSWYVEYAGKTSEAIRNVQDTILDIFETPINPLLDRTGSIIYSSLSFSKKGIGITAQYRRVEDYSLRTSPNEILLNGIFNYLPALTKQNTLRLISRYNAVAQELDEQTIQIDIIYTPAKGYTFNANFSNVTTLDGDLLFREAYLDFKIKKSRNWNWLLGGQFVQYNQEVLEVKPNAPLVEAITPFTEFTYKFDRKKSLRTELQYQHNEQDFGSWLYGLLEFNMAPSFSISASDMWNFKPKKPINGEVAKLHYYLFSATYAKKATRFTFSYGRTVEGIICTGGVCRFEPAFSGAKFGLSTSF
jgi:hypothetical protein